MKHEAIEYRPPRAGRGQSAGLKKAVELAQEELKKNPRTVIRMRYDERGMPLVIERRVRPTVAELQQRMGMSPAERARTRPPPPPKPPTTLEWLTEVGRFQEKVAEMVVKKRKNGRKP